MMHRGLVQNLTKFVVSKNSKAFSTGAANTIKLTFVDREGNRATVPARVGTTLLDAAQRHKIDLEGPCRGGGAATDVQRTPIWNETTFGEGPDCFYCHVQIPSTFSHLLPRQTEVELKGLHDVWGNEFTVTSRLACQITLEKKHDGLVVFVPDAPPVELL